MAESGSAPGVGDPARWTAAITPGPDVGMPIQEVIITMVGEYASPDGELWSGGLALLLQELGFSMAASRVALARVVSRGLLQRVKRGRRAFYRTTDRMQALLEEGRRQTFWFRYEQDDWEGDWTFVWHAVPERLLLQRRRLARRLGFLGFATLQDGLWISPRDRQSLVADATTRLGLEEYVIVMIGSSAAGIDDRRILAQAWPLNELTDRYTRFVATFGSDHGQLAALSDREAFMVRANVLETFRQLAPLDPKVDCDSAPWVTARQEAVTCFLTVEDALRQRATDFVTEMCQPR
jgi:phenylacetic acid degradation operon negative regulatory protein